MLYIGACGFSYKDWIGAFYPPTIKPSEMLGYYARHFPAVEIDASYYGILAERVVAAMSARTPRGFRFCFKTPRSLTHESDLDAQGYRSQARQFVMSLRPMEDAKKLGAVLLQFPNAFHPRKESWDRIRRLASELTPLPLVAEFRHRDWQNAGTLELLADLGVGWCNVDMPLHETLLHPSSDVTSSIAYARFHGRNSANWWHGTNVTRYDYAYEASDLEPWVDRLADIAGQAQTAFAFFNNHARGNAVRNAEMLERMVQARFGAGLAARVSPGEEEPAQEGLFR